MNRRAVLVALLASATAPAARGQRLEVGESGAVSIERYGVDVLVEEGIARVEIEQAFRSKSDRVSEGIYRFKLPEDAVIGSFSMWMEGKEKRARVTDAKSARTTYDAIVRKQRDPGLLEQVGWREFRVNVFPIPAHDTVRVKLSYAHAVRDDATLEVLEVPLPVGCGKVADLRVRAEVRAARGLCGLDSSSHPAAAIVLEHGRGRADWAAQDVVPSGPFVLRSIVRRSSFDVALLVHRDPRSAGGWFVARIAPGTAAAPPIARDVVFVIDRSGSMLGTKLEQARAALLAGLDTLLPIDRFAIVTFSTDVTALGDTALLPATPENVDAARGFARDLSASGGTALHAALLVGLRPMEPDPQRFRAVILLTDGAPTVGVTHPDQILASWRKSSEGVRLFAFGVGNEVGDFLLTKLAAEGRGDARYVRDGDDLEIPLSAFFERVRSPLLIDPELRIEGEGLRVTEREPRRLPDVFRGRAFLVCGRFDRPGRAVLQFSGRSGAEVVRLDVPVEFPSDAGARPHLAQIWAKTRIERLLDDLRVLGPNRELNDEIRSLGLAHGLVTPFTSFLVVEDGERIAAAGDGTPEARIPLPADTVSPPGNPGGPATPSAGAAGSSSGPVHLSGGPGSPAPRREVVGPTTGGLGGRRSPGCEADRWEAWWKHQEARFLPVARESVNVREAVTLELRKRVDDAHVDVASEAAFALGRVAAPEDARALAALTRALSHPERNVREAATLALGFLGAQEGVAPLRSLLLDTAEGRALAGRPDGVEESVSAFAAAALGLIADPTAIDDLQRAATDRSFRAKPSVASAAVLALGRMKDRQEEIAKLLVTLVDDRAIDGLVRAQAPIALGKLAARSAAGHDAARRVLATVLLPRIQDDTTEVQLRRSLVIGVGMLARPDDAHALAVLEERVDGSGRSSDESTRHFAILALGEIGARSAAESSGGAPTTIGEFLLRQITQPRSISNQPFAALALAISLRDRPDSAEAAVAREKLLETFEGISNPSHRGALALALALLGHRAAIDDLYRALGDTNDDPLAGHLALALGMLGDRAIAPKLRAMVLERDRKPATRIQAARALGLLNDRATVPSLITMLDGADALAGSAFAAGALAVLGGEDAANALLGMLADPTRSPLGRSIAIAELGRLAERPTAAWRLDLASGINHRALPSALAEALELR